MKKVDSDTKSHALHSTNESLVHNCSLLVLKFLHIAATVALQYSIQLALHKTPSKSAEKKTEHVNAQCAREYKNSGRIKTNRLHTCSEHMPKGNVYT